MTRKKIMLADKVRWVYPNYFTAMKDDYSQQIYWKEPKENIDGIVIGGEYEVIDIKRDWFFFKMYKLNYCNLWVDKSFLIKSTVDTICPFNIGDEVFFKPKCSDKELELLKIANPTLNLKRKYKVVKVINNYYVILNTPFPEEWIKYTPSDQIEDISIPIRWIDLEKA